MKGCFIQCLSMVTIYSQGNLFAEGLLVQFYSTFNASSDLKTFSYLVLRTIFVFHALGQAELILYVCYFIFLHLFVFLPFLNASSAQKWKKTEIHKSECRAGNLMQWFWRAINLCIISVKIYAAIMVKVTFDIKSNV